MSATGHRLALCTCTPQLEVALEVTGGAGPASVVRLAGTAPRSSLLLAAVDLVVEEAGIDPGEIAQVVVTRGPGSFTGIRAALASAAGIRAGTGAEVVAYDSLAGDRMGGTARPSGRGLRPAVRSPARPPAAAARRHRRDAAC